MLKSCVKLTNKDKRLVLKTDLTKEMRVKRSEVQKDVGRMRREGNVMRVAERGKDPYIEEKKRVGWQKPMG